MGAPADPGDAAKAVLDKEMLQHDLQRIAHMFSPYRDDPVMRDLCRLAIKCAQERLISV